jgi:hypothetical protein
MVGRVFTAETLVDIIFGCPAHQMHSCLSLILITCKMVNSALHVAQESLCCSIRCGARLEVGPSLMIGLEMF